MSTTITRTIRIGSLRLVEARGRKPISLCIALSDACRQGVFAPSAVEQTNNCAPYTAEPDEEVAAGYEGQLFTELFDSMLICAHTVKWKPQVKAFINDGAKRIHSLTTELVDGTYRSRPPKLMTVYYPKKRQVSCITYRDRIYQRWLCDNYIYANMTKSFIWANCSCQKGKGNDVARDLLKKYLWRHYTHYGNSGYALQIDIHSYYQSIPLDQTLALFKRKLAPRVYKHVEEILWVQYGSEGFYAGSQLIQILGVSYLDGLDHYIKEKLHIKGYIRYQDDFILIHPDKAYLEHCLNEITLRLHALGLELNAKKTHIKPISGNISWLGFIYTLQKDGKIYMRVSPKRFKEMRRKLRKHPQSLPSYITYIGKGGHSYKLIQRLIEEFGNENIQCRNDKDAERS